MQGRIQEKNPGEGVETYTKRENKIKIATVGDGPSTLSLDQLLVDTWPKSQQY